VTARAVGKLLVHILVGERWYIVLKTRVVGGPTFSSTGTGLAPRAFCQLSGLAFLRDQLTKRVLGSLDHILLRPTQH
jgi:hypothetical protein